MTRLFGGILLAAGLLIMTVSGLCSLFIVVSGFDEAMRNPSLALVPLLFGGLPFLFGFGCVFAGRALLRADRDR